MKKYQLSKTAILKWIFLRNLIFIILYIVFFDIFNIHKILYIKNFNILYFYSVIYIIFTFLYPIIKYLNWSYYINENFIELKYGIILKKIVFIPIDRIKYIDLIQGPVSKVLSIKTIRIYTARGKLTIPCINYKECTRIWNLVRNNTFMR